MNHVSRREAASAPKLAGACGVRPNLTTEIEDRKRKFPDLGVPHIGFWVPTGVPVVEPVKDCASATSARGKLEVASTEPSPILAHPTTLEEWGIYLADEDFLFEAASKECPA
jgi:hypothetical protein